MFESLLNQLEKGEELHQSSLDVDTTDFPITVNVVNPNRGKYFAPNCRLCKSKNCNNCPLPFNKQTTLRELLDSLAHKKKFNQNDLLFKSPDELREDDNNSDDNGKFKNNKSTWDKFGSNDDDENAVNQSEV